jgi:hypothetical protein
MLITLTMMCMCGRANQVSSVKTLTNNYETILNDQLTSMRELKQEIIEFLEHIVELADGLKVKQIKMDRYRSTLHPASIHTYPDTYINTYTVRAYIHTDMT